MRKQILFILAFIIVFLTACGSAPVAEPTAEQENEAKTEFTKEDFLQDYDQLWEDLYQNYPFFPVLERRGIDVEKIQQFYRNMLEERVSDLNGFAALLSNMFYDMDNFAHLSLMDVEVYELYAEVAELEMSQQEAEIWNEFLQSEQTQTSYGLLKESGSVQMITLPEVAVSYYPDSKAIYFHFYSFDYSLIARDENVVKQALSQYEDARHIIFDITDNKGGAVNYWVNNIVAPFGGEYEFQNYIFLGDTPVNRQFVMDNNLLSLQPVSELPADYEVPSFLEEFNMTYFYCQKEVLPEEGQQENTIESDAKRWVLINNNVYSSAESFAIFCKNTGWATLVGTQTMGDGDMMSPLLFSLKNTGLLVRFSTTTLANQDGTANVEEGTKPDIVCKVNESPLDACLRLIAKRSSIYSE
ncbi:MAG: S41 family peptidase [Lachnospiraceae bacterium]